MDNEITVRFSGQEFRFVTDQALFSPRALDQGSRLLLEAIVVSEKARTSLDLGCGWGGMGIILARLNPDRFVYLADNDSVALGITKKNIFVNDVKNARGLKVDVTYQTLPQRFDLIVCNPPWAKNQSVVGKMIAFAHEHLSTNSTFALVINQKFQTSREIERVFRNVCVVCEVPPYKVLRSFRNWELAEE